MTSLIHRPSHRLGFAVCENGRGRPGPFCHVNDVSVYLGRQRVGGVLIRKNTFCAHVFCFSAWGQKLQDYGLKFIL